MDVGGFVKVADRGAERVVQYADDNDHQELMSMAEDWWQQVGICQVLSSYLMKYMLGFYISAEIEKQVQSAFYTGFLLDAEEQLVWVTAGHIIKVIEEVLSREDITVKEMRWMDDYQVSGAESVLVHDRQLITGHLDADGIDFGFIGLSSLDAANIRQNPDIETMPADCWQGTHDLQSEAYFLFGFPGEWCKMERIPLSGGRYANRVNADVSIIPVTKAERPEGPEVAEFWNDPGAFYGQLLDFTDTAGGQPTDIKGMSGGPLVSVDRDREHGLVCRLLGVQSAWMPDSRVIRVEPMERVFEAIERRLRETDGTLCET